MQEYEEEKEPISFREEDKLKENFNTDIISQEATFEEFRFPEHTVLNSEEAVQEIEREFMKMRDWFSLNNWVCWTLKLDKETGKYRKIPISPRTGKFASTSDPSSWTVGCEAIDSYTKALAIAKALGKTEDEAKLKGIGFVFEKKLGIIGIDIDHCINPETGEINDIAKELMQKLNSYTEISQSGEGIHIYIKGEIPRSGRNDHIGLEIYGECRYFVVTRKPVEGFPMVIYERSKEIKEIVEKHLDKRIEKPSEDVEACNTEEVITKELPPEEQVVFDRAINAKNGSKFKALWDKKYGDLYTSQSNADMALCGSLAFWTNKNVKVMDSMFRKSKLMRDKWDEKHSGDSKTYGQMTIEKAIDDCTNVYTPPKSKQIKHSAISTHDEVISAVDLMLKEFVEKPWVVKDILHQGLTLLCGKPKMGKSWMVLALGIIVAGGGKFLGNYESMDTGEVLYLALEDTHRRLKDRINMLLKGENPPEKLSFTTRYPSGEDGIEKLEKWLKEHPDTKLIIIDTLAKIRGLASGDVGTLYSEDYEVIGGIKALADSYNVSIVLVHHLRKMTSSDPVDEVSGSTGLTGSADSIIILKRERNKADGTLFLTGRDFEEKELTVKFDLENMGWNYVGEVEEAEVNISEERQVILDVLGDSDLPMSPKEIATILEKNYSTIKTLLSKLLKEGLVQNEKGKYSVFEHPVVPVVSVVSNLETLDNTGLQGDYSKNEGVVSYPHTNDVIDELFSIDDSIEGILKRINLKDIE